MKNILMIVSVTTLLSGCSLFAGDQKRTEMYNQMIEDGVESLNQKTTNFSIFDSSYLTVSKISERSKYENKQINIYSVSPMSLMENLDFLETQYNIPYYIADFHALTKEDKEAFNEKMRVVYQGNLKGFLSYLSKLYAVDIKLDDANLLSINFYQTKTYSLDQFINGNKASTSLSVGGGEGTAGGLTGKSESTIESDTWEKIDKYLTDIIGENGSSTILEDFSIVKVTARPWVIQEIDQLFERLKLESQMQVAVQYRVITLSQSKLDQLAAKFGINLTGNDYTVTTQLVDAISLDAVGGGLAGSKRSVSGRLDAIVQNIGQEVVSEGKFVGLPNRIMPINLTTTTAYISEISREENQSIDRATTSVKTDEIKTGLSILILPKVLEDGRIQLTSGFTEKKLISLDSLSGIQLPTIDETETLSTVTIDSGAVELIALYSVNTDNSQEALQLIGGGKQNQNNKKIIAVLIGADSYKLSSAVSKRG